MARLPRLASPSLFACAWLLAGCLDAGETPVNWRQYNRPEPPDPVDAEVPPDASDASDAGTEPPLHVEVALQNIAILPSAIRIAVGGTVTWQNFDLVAHDVRSGSPAAPTTLFNSGLLDRGDRFTFQFDVPGRIEYFCSTHANVMMGAVVEVVE